MFVSYQVNANFKSFFDTFVKVEDDCMFLLPNNEVKLFDVIYLSNYEDKIKSLIERKGDYIHIKTPEIGLYKRDNWKFQHECRYRLLASPFDMSKINVNNKTSNFDIMWTSFNSIFLSMIKNKEIKLDHIDMPLNSTSIDNMDILLGPKCSEAERIIVEALTKDLHNSSIESSFFTNKIREK